MAPARHSLDRAWELATGGSALPEWESEQDLLHVLTPGPCARWVCGTRQRVLWRVHPHGGSPPGLSLKLVTAEQWRGSVAQLATDIDPCRGGTTITVPHLPPGTYWIQIACGSRLLASSKPFTIGPAADARPSYENPRGYPRARGGRPSHHRRATDQG